MSHKIKFNLSNKKNKKQLEDQPNEKISISIGEAIVKTNKVDKLENQKLIPKKISVFSRIVPVKKPKNKNKKITFDDGSLSILNIYKFFV